MKFKKSILSVVLILSMLINAMVSTGAYANTLDNKTSINKMKQLGIMNISAEDANKKLTKGEFIKHMTIIYGLKDTAESLRGATIFPDVNAGSSLSGYINAIMAQGLLYGTDDGYYHADKGVTYEEACITIVRMLGYSKSDLTGSYPTNYMKKAADLKLTYQINLKKDDVIPIWAEAVLFDRLFDSLIKGSTTEFFSDKYFTSKYPNNEITGKLIEGTIIGNSKTSDDLGDNEVYMFGQGLMDKVKYTVKRDAGNLELGSKYKLYLDGATITKVCLKENSAENSVENYAVSSVSGPIISYKDNNDMAKTMKLPEASSYYYHGVSIDYDVAVKAIKAYSSIILTKNSDNSGNKNLVIVDPNFGEPEVYRADNVKLVNQLKNTKYAFIYRGANIQSADLNAYDVVYFVSDIWNKNTFIYVNDKVAIGTITAFIPDILNPTGLTINNVNYTFSKYFNKTKLTNYDGSIENFITNVNINDFKTLVLGVDGTIVDIY